MMVSPCPHCSKTQTSSDRLFELEIAGVKVDLLTPGATDKILKLVKAEAATKLKAAEALRLTKAELRRTGHLAKRGTTRAYDRAAADEHSSVVLASVSAALVKLDGALKRCDAQKRAIPHAR